MREASRIKLEGGSTVLLISDGHANAGEQNPKFFADVAAKSATEKITSASIGLGNGYDETILEAGQYTKVAPGEYHQFEAIEDCVAFELYWAEFDHDDIARETVGHAK